MILSATWRIGRNVRFAGPLHRRSYGGTVITGDNCEFGPWVNIDCATGGKLIFGSGVSVNQGCVIVCRDTIEIGNNVRIGEYASIRDNDHRFDNINIPIAEQGFYIKPVFIGSGTWIGRNAVIMPGVSVGINSIIGANAVVTKDVPSNSVSVGVPAKIVKKRI